MKTVFLTSSPTGDLDGRYQVEGFDTRSGFRDALRTVWPENARCLMVTAFPEDIAASEEMTAFFRHAAEISGFGVQNFDLWDSRTKVQTADPCEYQVIFLGGGHVPTQNAFFQQLKLREKLRNFDGVIIGISAGTMNCADEVYCPPELPGEAADPGFGHWLKGLGLTSVNILPHYQIVREDVIDGMRLYEDIIFPDSAGREFLALPDGSYVVDRDGCLEVCGEAHWVRDGALH